MSTVVVKLGSSIVAQDSGALRHADLSRICAEVARLHGDGTDVVVVTSGAIAHGMHALQISGRPRQLDELQAASAMGQGRLYRVYDELLSGHGLRTAQVLLTFFDMSARTHYINARHTLRALLRWRVVPVINENDTTTTDEISFGDNDFLAAQVAVLLQARLLVLLTNTAGVFTANPGTDPDARQIPEITDFDGLTAEIGHEVSALGSGGMRSKVIAAEMATAAGIETVIGSGHEPETILRAAAGEPAGTRCRARPLGMSSFKLWLRYAKAARGTVLVDDGAARALREGGTSLLPVGITGIEGEFDPGDAVIVAAAGDRSPIGKGLVNYTTGELRRIMGLKSGQVQDLMPRATHEAIHRDHFVLD